MSSITVTSAVSSSMPINKVNFTCKIENFAESLRIYGTRGFYSPELKVVSYHEGQVHPLKILIKKDIPYTNIYNIVGITENCVVKSMEEFTTIRIELINSPNTIKFGLAGSMSIEMPGKQLSGSFGNADVAEFSKHWNFSNQTRTIFTHHVKINGHTGLPNCLNYSGFLVNNKTQTLVVNVQLTIPGVVANSISILPCEHNEKNTGTARLLHDIKDLLNNADEYSDFTILCGGKSFPCHEAILRARSPVFDKMFQLDMTERTSRKLTIEDVRINSIHVLLEFLYTGEITSTVYSESEIIFLGDKYDIQGLLELTYKKLPGLDDQMIVDILFVANRHNLENFKKVAMQRVHSNKAKFVNDDEFLCKLKQTPDLLLEFFKL